MITSHLLRKSLAVGIIILFISVAVVPTINYTTVKAAIDNDLVEVTSEACGIQGYGNTTVKLTKQQYQNLESYLTEFRARLNQTTTREEAVPLFKDVVVELHRYGLLPRGMSVEKAQSLVIGRHSAIYLTNLIKKIKYDDSSQNNGNYYCLIAGHTGLMTQFQGIITAMLDWPGYFYPTIAKILHIIFFLSCIVNIFFPASVFQFIGLGGLNNHGTWVPAVGWVYTIGSGGIRQWNGDLYGMFPFVLGNPFGFTNVAVEGFTGLRLFLMTNFYLGTASSVSIYQY